MKSTYSYPPWTDHPLANMPQVGRIIRTASRVYSCCDCAEPIQVGQLYTREVYRTKGRPVIVRSHKHHKD